MERFLRRKPPVPVAESRVVASQRLPSDMTVVSSVADLLLWPQANASAAAKAGVIDPDARVCDAYRQLHDGVTSAFSGVCAETVASNCLIAHEKKHGHDILHPVHHSSIDKDEDCAIEQQLVPQGPCCVYGDILDFCTEDTKSKLSLESVPYDLLALAPLILAPGALRLDAFCRRHRTRCKHRRASLHSSGCPCTDFTTWGKCRRLQGPTVQSETMFLLYESSNEFPFAYSLSCFRYPTDSRITNTRR